MIVVKRILGVTILAVFLLFIVWGFYMNIVKDGWFLGLVFPIIILAAFAGLFLLAIWLLS